MKSGPRVAPIQERLDRFIADKDWNPIFRFDDCWAREPDCISLVQTLWAHSTRPFTARLSTICDGLRQWKSSKRAADWGRIPHLRSEINCLSSRRLNPGDLEALLAAKGELRHLLNVQEVYWAQCSWVLWLSAGDRNTSFFHAKASARRKKNVLMGLCDANDHWQTSTSDVLHIASDYFVDLFSAGPLVEVPAFLEHIPPSVTEDMNSALTPNFTSDGVSATFRGINPRKSPEIDGLPSGFFRQHWDILGEDFVSLCLDLLRGHADMASVNETVIVLIPKVDKPTSMRQLHPISLCIVIYKMVSKVLVNSVPNVAAPAVRTDPAVSNVAAPMVRTDPAVPKVAAPAVPTDPAVPKVAALALRTPPPAADNPPDLSAPLEKDDLVEDALDEDSPEQDASELAADRSIPDDAPYDPMVHKETSDMLEEALEISRDCVLLADLSGVIQADGEDLVNEAILEAADSIIREVAASILGVPAPPDAPVVPSRQGPPLSASPSKPGLSKSTPAGFRRTAMPVVPEHQEFDEWCAARSCTPPANAHNQPAEARTSSIPPPRPHKRQASSSDPSRAKRPRASTSSTTRIPSIPKAGMSSVNNSPAETARQSRREK
ncbi:hypothetical protein GQ457_17G008210 [Hibiscus cannabinus]